MTISFDNLNISVRIIYKTMLIPADNKSPGLPEMWTKTDLEVVQFNLNRFFIKTAMENISRSLTKHLLQN